jgi:hypothetical protein
MFDRKGYPQSIYQAFKKVDDDGTSIPIVAIDGDGGGTGGLTDEQLRAAPVQAETLGAPTVPRQLAVTTTSASVALTASCRRISIRARGCDMRYVIGTGAQTANAGTSHFIAQDERLDLAVPAGATIAAIRETAATANGSLAITELA